MAVGRQIKIFSNFRKKSSKESQTRNSLCNLANEYERIGEQKNPDINSKLSTENVILKHFEVKDYDEIVKNTDYSLNGKNSKYEDIYTTTPTIQATNFVNLGGVNLTFLASKDEWVEYYKDVSTFIKDYMGDDFKTLCEVIQFDEFTPHLQLMGIFRSEVSNETLADKNLESDPKLFDEISRKQFTRYNNKQKGTDDYIDPKNKKEYKLAKEKWVEAHREEIIKNYKPRNKTTEKQYAYIRKNNPMATIKNSYSDYQQKLFEFCKEHKFIKQLCEKATEIRGEKVYFVKNTTEPVYDGKSKDHYEIKETIERENKEIENKIKAGIDLTENEVYRHIRKQNREILKKEFSELDVSAWGNRFKEPIRALYGFDLKLSNDYIKTAKEIAYKPYLEQEEKLDELKNEFETIKSENTKSKNIQKELSEKISKLNTTKSEIATEIENIKQIKKKYTEDKKWQSIQTISKIDDTKEVKRKSMNPLSKDYKKEIVILDKDDYEIMLNMSKDQSTQLTAWKNYGRKKDKEVENLENEKKYYESKNKENLKEIDRLRDVVGEKYDEIKNLTQKHQEELKSKDKTIKKLEWVIDKTIAFIEKIPFMKEMAGKLKDKFIKDYDLSEKDELSSDIKFFNEEISKLPTNEFTKEIVMENRNELLERKEEIERPKYEHRYGGYSR